ncbi:MAG: hypothetical protein RSC05_14775, partial [Acinetobacter sp.]
MSSNYVNIYKLYLYIVPISVLSCSFSAVSKDFIGDGTTTINGRQSLQNFAVYDSHIIDTFGESNKLSNGVFNDKSIGYMSGNFNIANPRHLLNASNITFNNDSSFFYGNAVVMRDFIFTGNSELKSLPYDGTSTSFHDRWIDVDGMSAYDNATLNFDFGVIGIHTHTPAKLKNIFLHNSSQLSIDGLSSLTNQALAQDGLLVTSHLFATDNAVIYLKNQLIASDISLNGQSSLNVESQSQVSSVEINNNAQMLLSDGSSSRDTTVNDNGSILINGENTLASNTQLNSGNIHIIKGAT